MDVNDVMHRKRARRIWGILKKVNWVESCHLKKKGDRGLEAGATRVGGGGRWKSQHRKIVPHSLCRETFNSKVIKGFVPELRSRAFRVSGFLCSMYICYEHSMYVTHIRIWLWYTISSAVTSNYCSSSFEGLWGKCCSVMYCFQD